MRRELSDLIPVIGFVRVSSRIDKNLDEEVRKGINGKITLREFQWRSFKDSAYFTLTGIYNIALLHNICRAIEYFYQ